MLRASGHMSMHSAAACSTRQQDRTKHFQTFPMQSGQAALHKKPVHNQLWFSNAKWTFAHTARSISMPLVQCSAVTMLGSNTSTYLPTGSAETAKSQQCNLFAFAPPICALQVKLHKISQEPGCALTAAAKTAATSKH